MSCNFEFASSVHLAQWFLTPYDPRTEIRLSEFGDFKKQVADMLHKQKKSKEEVVKFVHESKHMFVTNRTFDTVSELVENMGLKSSE